MANIKKNLSSPQDFRDARARLMAELKKVEDAEKRFFDEKMSVLGLAVYKAFDERIPLQKGRQKYFVNELRGLYVNNPDVFNAVLLDPSMAHSLDESVDDSELEEQTKVNVEAFKQQLNGGVDRLADQEDESESETETEADGDSIDNSETDADVVAEGPDDNDDSSSDGEPVF